MGKGDNVSNNQQSVKFNILHKVLVKLNIYLKRLEIRYKEVYHWLIYALIISFIKQKMLQQRPWCGSLQTASSQSVMSNKVLNNDRKTNLNESNSQKEIPLLRWIINRKVMQFQYFTRLFNAIHRELLKDIIYNLYYYQLMSTINSIIINSINSFIVVLEVNHVVKTMDSLEVILLITVHAYNYNLVYEIFYIGYKLQLLLMEIPQCKLLQAANSQSAMFKRFLDNNDINNNNNYNDNIICSWDTKIEVVLSDVIGGNFPSFNWPNPFYSLIGNKSSTAIFYIITAAIVITGIVIGFVILCCLISHCQARGKGGRN
jgi:hypothetical protein